MTSDEMFIKGILAAPRDLALRLVYADWLEERGDPRTEFVRLQVSLAVGVPDEDDARKRRLEALRPTFDSLWLAVMCRGIEDVPKRPNLAKRERRRRKRELLQADVAMFLKQYARKAEANTDPNDRRYSRQLEERLKRMRPEDLDRLIRGEDDE
jgi:uncharacterized protein (TIGR02996 family)